MEHRLPTEEVRIFHVGKSVFHMGLTAIGEHNLLLAPVLTIGEQNSLAQRLLFNAGQGGGIATIAQLQMLSLPAHGNVQQLRHVLAGADLACVLDQTLLGIALALGTRPLGAAQLGLQFLQGALFLG